MNRMTKREECEVPPHGSYTIPEEQWIEKLSNRRFELAYGIDRLISRGLRVEGVKMDVLGIYGCGAMGCTMALSDPSLVVKVTTDRSEVQLWEGILRAQEEDSEVMSAFAGVVSVKETKTKLGTSYWEIVREAVEPAFDLENGSGHPTPRTVWYVIGEPAPQLSWYAAFDGITAHDIEDDLKAQDYEMTGDQIERARMLQDGNEDLGRMEECIMKYHYALEQALIHEDSDGVIEAQMEGYNSVVGALSNLEGPWQGIRDGLLTYITQEGSKLWPTDLHLGNVGWRKVCEGDPPEQLVIYDFQGFRMRKNGRQRDTTRKGFAR